MREKVFFPPISLLSSQQFFSSFLHCHSHYFSHPNSQRNLILPFWEAWLGVSSFACLALYYKKFLQPWHTQVQIALLFGSYLWTGTQDKANGRSSLATVCCPQQYIRNKPVWRIPSRKIHLSAFLLLFFLSVEQWAVWKWRGQMCLLDSFCCDFCF